MSTEEDKKKGDINDNKELPINPQTGRVNEMVTVVIPYVKRFALDKKLEYAIASWLKFFRHPLFNIVVIGDEEEYLKDEEGEEVPTVIAHVCTSDNPQVDLMEKLKIAIAAPEVADRFILAADDIFLVSPVTLADIETLKISKWVTEKSYTGVKAENYKRTSDLLRINLYPCYETHLPVVFEKEKWIELLEAYPQLSEGGYFFTSVYFRHFFLDFVPVILDWNEDIYLLPVISARPDENVFEKLIHQKKFLTTAQKGFSPWLQNYLACLYSRKNG
ncbi:hypothetical protein EZS27_009979 [termite gut metagenome]|uniref:Glycosyltransferase 2-like domain-containing protein n=1 Tax=termite gut metagenome TaxID=433724 RepID=A0A5J4S7Y9_9ZZZZ